MKPRERYLRSRVRKARIERVFNRMLHRMFDDLHECAMRELRRETTLGRFIRETRERHTRGGLG